MADISGTAGSVPLDLKEQVARIRRAREQSENFVAERKRLMGGHAELAAGALEFERDRMPVPPQIALSGMASGAAFFGAGAALVKPLGP